MDSRNTKGKYNTAWVNALELRALRGMARRDGVLATQDLRRIRAPVNFSVLFLVLTHRKKAYILNLVQAEHDPICHIRYFTLLL
ncbi:MAG: hypothetical protein U9R05_03550, partial [Chloroflexota bacterium]|nr:hypothetical protein [Chloroflexota bacterium]